MLCTVETTEGSRVLLVCSVPLHHRLSIAGILVLQHPKSIELAFVASRVKDPADEEGPDQPYGTEVM